MEKSRSNSKIKIPKAKASNENISPMKLETEDQMIIGRGRFHQSMALSPTLQSFAENLDINSPLARYLRAGSPISGKVSPSGESFNSPTIGSHKPRSAIVQQYNSSSGGSSSCGSRNRLSISPLSSIENLEMMPLMASPVYGTPVKAEEEVLVMDDIQVRPSTSGGKRLGIDVAKKFANGKDQRPVRLSGTHKSEAHANKSSAGTGPSTCGPRSRNFHQFHGAAGLSEDAVVKTSKPASSIKPEPNHAPANSYTNDWSPLDDDIVVALPHGSPNNNPSRKHVDSYVSGILYGASTKRRLPVFVELCSEQSSP
ncbi:uncharacterized protein LOC129285046 [Prosopis cineraria]|uniref:uncharacterized protein LOC129285046 n=1 Tax=Prosopis cineraria TaxID=364024 RepID=UPI00240EF7BD|nr:uncharacterized protein LOC129285046 [Prosopis cineraria]XP_054776563.1 uncharacterized protein LOC129285046 [Prosopis cineraria]XP_054776564.1 uncharacterized protein LOC129285046 [Prosopis cineraria]